MESKVISQKEYLKKYLSSGSSHDKKKKKKKKPKIGQQTVKLIDDDIDLKSMRPIEDGEFDILLNSEDAPQIAGIVDERGPVDFSDKRRWKIIAKDDDGDITISSIDKGGQQSNIINEKLSYNDPKSTKHYSDEDTDLPRNQRNDSDDDLSPPRTSNSNVSKNKHGKSCNYEINSNIKSSKNKRIKSSSVNSNRSKRSKHSDVDLSPATSRKCIDSDESPPRRKDSDSNSIDIYSHKQDMQREDSDLSPPRPDKNYESDLSPPRRRDKSRHSNSRSERHSTKHRNSSNLHEGHSKDRISKTQQTKRSDNIDSFRKNRNYKDTYNRHEKEKEFHKDVSQKRDYESRSHTVHRGSKDYGTDNYKSSNVYKKHRSHRRDSDSESNEETPKSDKRMKKTLDGKTAGLQDAKALKEETEAHKKREVEQFRKLSKEVSGVGQATVVRDRQTGRKRNLEAEAAEEREKQQRQAELNEKYTVWGRGVKQVEDREEKLKDDLYEMSKPLARYADDADLDKALRQQEREGDPMLQYIKQKQIKEGKRKPDQPRYEGTFMPNRFGIKPGHRWDGVDRSNGYEKRWFEAQNAKVARQEEAYKWSTSDM